MVWNIPTGSPDQEFEDIARSFALGQIPDQGAVPEKLHHMILLAALTTHQLLGPLKQHLIAALNSKLTQDEIKETFGIQNDMNDEELEIIKNKIGF